MRALLFIAILLTPALAAAAPEADARHWLERVATATRSLNYEGTFVYRHQGNLEAMRIVHKADGDGEMERLYSLSGAAREIVRDGEKVTCILPDDRSVMADRRQLSNPLSGVVPGDVGSLEQGYRLQLEGSGRIADRDATIVGIAPRDEYRYGYRLWIDQATGLLLRADLLGEEDEPVEQVMFTELRTLDVVPAAALAPSVSGDGFTWYRTAVPAGDGAGKSASGWQADSLPEGFRLAVNESKQLPGSAGPVEHLMFSDGLASVSVYIEPADPARAFAGHSRMGAVNAYGRTIGEHQVTVVGEVPAATVARVAESLRRETNGQ